MSYQKPGVFNASYQSSITKFSDDRSEPESEAIIAKNAFIANISHEIRTPMNAIMGFAQMLQSTELNVKQADYVDVILDSGKKLLILINNLLDLSNLQLGKTSVYPVDFELDTMVTKLWSQFMPLIMAKNITPVIQRPLHLPVIHADREKLERVLSFILSNALKFTLRGQICLRVMLLETDGDAATLEFQVEDTGCGMDAIQLRHVFDAFEQADNSITRSYPGLGLGLSLSGKLVDLLGGVIGASSTPGLGTCFSIKIPVEMH